MPWAQSLPSLAACLLPPRLLVSTSTRPTMTEVTNTPAPDVEESPAATATTTAAPAEAEAAPAPTPAAETSAAPEKPEVPEPQNELTKKFTEEEWAALKEFKVCASADRDHSAYLIMGCCRPSFPKFGGLHMLQTTPRLNRSRSSSGGLKSTLVLSAGMPV